MNRRQMRMGLFSGTLLFLFLYPTLLLAGWHHDEQKVRVDIVTPKRGIIAQFDAGQEGGNVTRKYVIAKPDERFRVRIYNPYNRRIGVVVAVDGRNIISGKKSHLQSHERMYLLNPYQTQEFNGWRTGKHQVNRFYFTDKDNSYASHRGDESAMGVIAVAVFHEKPKKIRKPRPHHDPFYGNNGFRPFNKSHSPRRGPGTGIGEGEWSPSNEVLFAAKKRPSQKILIKYEWRKSLCRKGIVQCRPKHTPHGRERNRFWPKEVQKHRDAYSGYVPFPLWLLPPGFPRF